MMKYVVIILSALFVIISCTPKDRTAKINEIYEELEKEVADETKDESKTPDENLEPDDEQVEEDVEIIDELDEDAVDDSDVLKVSGAICTGQTKCYNETEEIPCPNVGEDFYGQDAQYLDKCVPRSYSISGTSPEEIVTDNNTGLEWQRTISENTFTWQDAIDYCDELNYGGYEDWRLPTADELSTIIDIGKKYISVDVDVFYLIKDNNYWSSSSFVNDSSLAHFVYFGIGDVSLYPKTETNHVQCVRGSSFFETSFAEYINNEKVVVKDLNLGLYWQKEHSEKITWTAALEYCENLDYAGFNDWRLPNINELKGLIDYTKYNPGSIFPEMVSDVFWSASSLVLDGRYSWFTDFKYGRAGIYMKIESNNYYARCVRNGE